MQKKNELIERLAELEHEQWVEWSRHLVRHENLTRKRELRWAGLWIPYADLDEDMKEHDRKWARKVYALLTPKLDSEYEDKILECARRGTIKIRCFGLSNFQSLMFHVNYTRLFWDGMNLKTPKHWLFPIGDATFDISRRLEQGLDEIRLEQIRIIEDLHSSHRKIENLFVEVDR